MLYNLNLVDILIRVESPFPLLDNDSTKEFYIDKAPNSQFDLNFIYQPVDELPVPKNASYIEGRRVYIGYGSEASTFFSPVPEGIPYAWVSRASLDEGILVCKYVPGKEYLLNYKRNVLILMDLEATLLHFDAIILHASFIRWREKGIIFTAPSGTGKIGRAHV